MQSPAAVGRFLRPHYPLDENLTLAMTRYLDVI